MVSKESLTKNDMAKTKKTDDEVLSEEIAKESNPEHFTPQIETAPPARPKAVDQSHLEPQKEVKQEEKARPKLADPKHAFPQE